MDDGRNCLQLSLSVRSLCRDLPRTLAIHLVALYYQEQYSDRGGHCNIDRIIHGGRPYYEYDNSR